MAYVMGNPKTKRELKEWLKQGKELLIFSPGPFGVPLHGNVSIEGPHYPKPHRWYAVVRVVNGYITKVIS